MFNNGFLHLFVIYTVWGSTFLATSIVLHEGFPPFLLAASRLTTAGAVLLLFAIARKQSIALNFKELINVAMTGILIWVGGHALVNLGMLKADSGYAALLFGSMPLWGLLLEVVFKGVKLQKPVMLSLVIGFLGILCLALPSLKTFEFTELPYLLALLIAPISWALGSIFREASLQKKSTFAIAGYQLLFGGLVCVLIASFAQEALPAELSWKAIGAWSYLTLFGSIIAFSSFVRALQLLPNSLVMSFAYVNPVIAVFLGCLVLNEVITGWTITGMLLISVGVGTLLRFNAKPVAPVRQTGVQELN